MSWLLMKIGGFLIELLEFLFGVKIFKRIFKNRKSRKQNGTQEKNKK